MSRTRRTKYRNGKYSETWLKRTPTGPKNFVRFNQVSALWRFSYVSLLEKRPKWSKFPVRLRQVSALEHVRFNQVSL